MPRSQRTNLHRLQLIFAATLFGLLFEQFGNVVVPEFQNVLFVVIFHGQFVSDPEDSVFIGGQRSPSYIDGIGDGRCRNASLGKVSEEGSENVAGEFGVSGGHGQVVAPDVRENVLQVVSMGHTHVHLFALQVDNGVLAAVLEQVLVGGHAVVGQDLGESICATRVHQVGQKVHVLWSELIFVFQVNVDKVLLTDLSSDGVQLGVVVGDDRQDTGQFVINKVVIVLSVVKGVEGQAVEESAFVLGLSDDKRHLYNK